LAFTPKRAQKGRQRLESAAEEASNTPGREKEPKKGRRSQIPLLTLFKIARKKKKKTELARSPPTLHDSRSQWGESVTPLNGRNVS